MCDLLHAFPGWEAIKTTRGHYRSCGKAADACCVSHLLSNEPLIRSGREQTYERGKDTGRYWDAGAANVHWVIVTEEQVEQGIKNALARITAPGVFIEGNSFTQFVDVDFMLMVARAAGGQIKSSARRTQAKASALYLSDPANSGNLARAEFDRWRNESVAGKFIGDFPVYTRDDLPQLIGRLLRMHSALAA